MAQENQNYSNKIEEKSHKFLRQLDSFISNYEGQLPNLRDIFRPEAIEWLLMESVECKTMDPRPLVDFVINAGYKDEPDVGEDGKPSSRRTTPIHQAVRNNGREIVPDLFKIYDRFDVNYTDEDGLTHFHVACKYGCVDVVKKFLDHGQDPNCLVTKTGDSPLLLAMKRNSQEVIELLLRNGANPNLANEEGTTLLHLLSDKDDILITDVIRMLFELSNAKYQPLQINAQNNLGNTPLHLAMRDIHKWFMDFLLKHGADPNATNEEGSTPMHLVCKQGWESAEFLEVFFTIAEKVDRVVEVDARDKKGRTPLQWAVANFLPDVVELLFDRGAKLDNFVFPTEINIVDRSELPRVAPRAMEVVERLQRRGYELQRNDALTIMKFFDKYELLEKSDIKLCFDEANNTFGRIGPKLLAIGLPPSEALNILGQDDLQQMSSTLADLLQLLDECSAKRVCEKATRRFFRRWALDPLLKLTNCELPILCCDKIMDQLMNKDLFNVCLAATDQSS